MGLRGPAPKPTALKLLQGERHRDRINDSEPIPRDALPVCPESVEPAVRAIWDFTMLELAHMKIVASIDRDALLAYCEAVVTHRESSALLHREGLTASNAAGTLVKHPATTIQRESAELIRRFAQEFGLTPSGRTRIRTMEAGAHAAAEEDNPFAVGQ